jgi:RNA polymerase sigma-32 factor
MAEVVQDYIQSIQKYSALSFEAEQELAKRWRDNRDERAYRQLMQSYLRLVVKVAMSYRGYGLPLEELVQEGNIGLMQGINRFEPERGFRLSTYAMWWIKAHIQEYILNNWSMVKIGTSSTQKKLFFNLRRLKAEMLGEDSIHLTPDVIKQIATKLNVSENDVVGMDQRLRHGNESLNAPIGGEEDAQEMQDFLIDPRPSQEEMYSRKQIAGQRKGRLMDALSKLDERERAIFVARHLTDSEDIPTLEALSGQYGVSRERVRQLEERAYRKVQGFLQPTVLH